LGSEPTEIFSRIFVDMNDAVTSSSPLLGSRIASITDRGNLGRPRSYRWNRLAVGVGPHTVRIPSAPVEPWPLQSFTVDSTRYTLSRSRLWTSRSDMVDDGPHRQRSIPDQGRRQGGWWGVKTPPQANLPNRYSALCWRPVTHAQTWASYSALYRFGRLSPLSWGQVQFFTFHYTLWCMLVNCVCWFHPLWFVCLSILNKYVGH